MHCYRASLAKKFEELLTAPGEATPTRAYEVLSLLNGLPARSNLLLQMSCSLGIDWPLKLLLARRYHIPFTLTWCSNSFLLGRATLPLGEALDLLYATTYAASDPKEQILTWLLSQRDLIDAAGRPVVIPVDAELAKRIIKNPQGYMHIPPPLPASWLSSAATDLLIKSERWRYDLDISALSEPQFQRLLEVTTPPTLLNFAHRCTSNAPLLRTRIQSIVKSIPEKTNSTLLITETAQARTVLQMCTGPSDPLLQDLIGRCDSDALHGYIRGDWEIASERVWPSLRYLRTLSTRGPATPVISAKNATVAAIGNGASFEYLRDLVTYVPGAAIDAATAPAHPVSGHGARGRYTYEDNRRARLVGDICRYISAQLEKIPVETLYAYQQLLAHPEVSLFSMSTTLARLHLSPSSPTSSISLR